MNTHVSIYHKWVIGLSLLFTLAFYLLPEQFSGTETVFFVIVMVLTGIPHGATDHLIYQYRQRQLGTRFSLARFLGIYFLAMGIYAVCWYYFPLWSLASFILISAYHFGQSQFLYLPVSEKHPLKLALYLSWGLLVLGAIVLLKYEQSMEVLSALLRGDEPMLMGLISLRYTILLTLLGISICLLGYALIKGYLKPKQLIWEGINLLVLGLVFHYCDLLLSFALYFGLWHSLSSILAEIQEFQKEDRHFSFPAFFKQALPFSLMSFGGIALLLGIGYFWMDTFSLYLLFFIAISTLTLPHMVFMNQFYNLRHQ